jgi:hypothetical protein
VKAGKPGQTDDLFEINNDALHLPENLAIKTESTSLGSKVHDVAGQDTECNYMPFISFFSFPFSFSFIICPST